MNKLLQSNNYKIRQVTYLVIRYFTEFRTRFADIILSYLIAFFYDKQDRLPFLCLKIYQYLRYRCYDC